jgi:predicted RecB family nuclease
MQLRSDAHESGVSFAAYCWNASAENQYLRRLGVAGDVLEHVEEFISSDEWIDLLRVWDRQLITGGSSSLKVVAPLVGVEWAVDDPGGGESMVRYDVAVEAPHHAEREAARRWLLDYNHGDVLATATIRSWLSARGGRVPPIESLDPACAEEQASGVSPTD